MKPYNSIVMDESIKQNKAIRMMAIAHRNAMNQKREADHLAVVAALAADAEVPPAPEDLIKESPEVMKATYDELRDNEAANKAAVDFYDKKVAQYDLHNG